MAYGDVDGDGIPDLFVGARIIPRSWPLPAPSRLYRGAADGSFSADHTSDDVLRALGLVTAATFADLTGDGRSDLVVASEWGPVRVLVNESGKLRDATSQLALAGTSSRWLGVTAGDFDGDGRLDRCGDELGRMFRGARNAQHPHAPVGESRRQWSRTLGARVDSTAKQKSTEIFFPPLAVAVPDVRKRIGSYGEYANADVSRSWARERRRRCAWRDDLDTHALPQ